MSITDIGSIFGNLWAEMFKASTWEELKMIAAEDKTINKAVSGVWQLTEEERIREQCRAREEWLLMDKWKTRTGNRTSPIQIRENARHPIIKPLHRSCTTNLNLDKN